MNLISKMFSLSKCKIYSRGNPEPNVVIFSSCNHLIYLLFGFVETYYDMLTFINRCF